MLRRAPLRSLLTFLSIISHVTAAGGLASSIDYRYFVAGGSCAAISHGITCPIDVVKTRMQSNPEKYKSLLPATATIIREEGASSLVKGLGPTLVSMLLLAACYVMCPWYISYIILYDVSNIIMMSFLLLLSRLGMVSRGH